MNTDIQSQFVFDNSFARALTGLYEPWHAATAPEPRLLIGNDALARELGIETGALRSPDAVAVLVGNTTPFGAMPIAQAYAGHQFGGFSPRLGDGRALLLGEVFDVHGQRRDLHLKGSGRTPFARGGDGKAAVGPMLREYLIGESLHALGIASTRALAVCATGEIIHRDSLVPGAVLTRVASSHLRVGSFQFAANSDDHTLLTRLADYAIARHYPQALNTENPYLALVDLMIEAQASLIAQWMQVGFIHGVMNTDNVTISGESIDFGPCAFMDVFDPHTVFSSIDHAGRYAYGNQPTIAQWNLARFAETLLPLIDEHTDTAIEVATELLRSFPARYEAHWSAGMHAKLGLSVGQSNDPELVPDFLALLEHQKVDYTSSFRALAAFIRGDSAPAHLLFTDYAAFTAWAQRWQLQLQLHHDNLQLVSAAMDAVNPLYIARNHLVEAALDEATNGNLSAFERLLTAVTQPFTPLPGMDAYTQPAPATFGEYRTYCGT